MHQLIVLGNGFDLACGLHSKFSDFQRYRAQRIPSLLTMMQHKEAGEQDDEESLGRKLYKEHATIWDALFTCGDTGLWRDVEGAIKTILIENSNPLQRKLSPSLFVDLLTGPADPHGLIGSALTSKGQAGPVALGFLKAYMEDQGLAAIDIHMVRMFLLDQLHEIERAFGAYLKESLRDTYPYYPYYNYISSAECLIDGLLTKEIPADQNDAVETSILDFNYTNPFSEYLNKHNNVHLVNIHGSLINPVFGIDGKDLMSDPDLVQFTKTYRILVFKNREQARIIHTDSGNHGEPTELIKFYGHSLGDADYSYFQAIFDGVDLYSSNTRLIFYYNVWLQDNRHECTDELAQQDMFHKVTRLMTEYGETMTNTDHGKNLMHKLLLEGRLTIERYRG